jgi:hypothetical protein
MADHSLTPSTFSAVAPDDLATLLRTQRYGARSRAFDEIVAAAESHYWDPDDPRYIEFGGGFDLKEQLLLPPQFTPELRSAAADRIGAGRRVEFANEIARFHLSQLLHGEQGGVALCANLCAIFDDPGAQEYAANQVREETRHVRALSRYIGERWGTPVGAGGRITQLMSGLVSTSEVHRKIVGMQIMIEGLALGTFSAMVGVTGDPVLARLLRLIMTDEAYHHRFGKIWGMETIPTLSEEQHRQVEDWAAGCFLTVSQNLAGAEQKQEVYQRFGLDWRWVQGAMTEAFAGPAARRELAGSNRVFRVLVKTLVQTGIVTSRTRALYNTWFDVGQLERDTAPDEGEEVAKQTTAELREINSTRKGGR